MKTNRFLTLLFAAIIAISSAADDNEKTKKKINSIKKNNQYLYAEMTAETTEEAREIAEEMLYEKINQWAAGNKKLQKSSGIAINNTSSLWTTISLPRGNMFRSFIYVKKSDILPVENSTVIENPNAKAETTPKLESIVQPVIPETVAELMEFTDYKPMAERIMQLKSEGRLRSYGYYAQLDDPEACWLAIYNTSGQVVAFLSPGKERTNLRTGKADSVGNYNGHGAIGFIINE